MKAKLRSYSLVAALCTACSPAVHRVRSEGSVPFEDSFDRSKLGPLYRATGGHWVVQQGAAYSSGAQNQPLFLEIPLPPDVVVEVDVRSDTNTVDAKIELMTDGRKHQSGYIFILGGWKNTISAIARLDEHGKDRVEKKPTKVTGRKSYRWRIEKQGGSLRWFIDGEPYLNFEDEDPLQGPGHDRLAFSNWTNQVRYDNLKVWAYDSAPKRQDSTRKETTQRAITPQSSSRNPPWEKNLRVTGATAASKTAAFTSTSGPSVPPPATESSSTASE